MFHWSSKVISKKSKGVSRKFNWCFSSVSRKSQPSLKGVILVSIMFQDCFNEVLRKGVQVVSQIFFGCFTNVSRMFESCRSVSTVF